MEYRTLQEYKEEVFNELTDGEKLKYMYNMSKQLCDISEYINQQINNKKGHQYSVGWQILKKLKKY